MSEFSIKPLSSDNGFRELYKKLVRLITQENPDKDRLQIIGIIEALFHYLSGLEEMVAAFNLNRVIQIAKLPDLEIDYLSGNLRSSKTLRKLQEQFSLNGKTRKSTPQHSRTLPKLGLISSSLSGKGPPDRKSSLQKSRQRKLRKKSRGETTSCIGNKL